MSERPRVGVLSCSRSKLPIAAPAADLYTGRLFLLSRTWVQRHCDAWCILSAKHGLVQPETVIAPYDCTLEFMPVTERRAWATEAHAALVAEYGCDVEFVVFAGLPYRAALVGFEHVIVPLEGLGIGEQLQRLNRMLRGVA